MKHARRLLGVLFAVAALLGVRGEACAQAPGGPRHFVETHHAAVNRLLRTHPDGPARAQRDEQVARILNSMLDIDELGRRALDPMLGQQSAEHQQQFLTLLRRLIESNYRQNLDATLDWGITYANDEPGDGGSDAVVRTVARSRTDARAAPVTVDYRLHRAGTAWIVYDIVTNNVSLVQTYHDAYTRIVREHGFDDLLARMRRRVDSLGRDAGASP